MARVYKKTRLVNGRRVKAKKWTVVYRDETDALRQTPGFRDKQLSRAHGRQLEDRADRVKAGLPVADASQLAAPLAALFTEYLQDLARRHRSPVHIAGTRRALDYVAAGCGFTTLGQVRADRLRKWLAEQSAGRGWSARTQNFYRDALSSFCQWCVRPQGWLADNPCAAVAKVSLKGKGRRKRRRAIEPAELAALLAVVVGKPRWAVYVVAAASGLRRSDLARLERRDCDLSDLARPLWRLRAEAVKEGRDVVLPMSAEAAEALAPLLAAQRTDRLFRGRVPLIRTLNRDLEAAGIAKTDDEGRHLDFHSLRYFFAKQMALRLPLMMVKTLLRHRDIRVTANLYAELGLTDVAEQTWALPRFLAAAPARPLPAPAVE